MTRDERAALDRQRRIARTPEVQVREHTPAPGQGSLFGRPKPRKKTGDEQSEKEGQALADTHPQAKRVDRDH